MHSVDKKIIELGLILPEIVNPIANYIPCKIIEKTLYISGQGPIKDGKVIYKGKLEAPKGELAENWKKRDQLLFNSTKFGDDTDRPLKKVDDTWTYFAADIAYHAYKIDRKSSDYYLHSNLNCEMDLSKSVFLEPTVQDSQLIPRLENCKIDREQKHYNHERALACLARLDF